MSPHNFVATFESNHVDQQVITKLFRVQIMCCLIMENICVNLCLMSESLIYSHSLCNKHLSGAHLCVDMLLFRAHLNFVSVRLRLIFSVKQIILTILFYRSVSNFLYIFSLRLP